VASKLAYGLLLVGILANPSLRAQQTPSLDPSKATATVHCQGEPYVSVTADAEQAVPLQVVATLHCDEPVLILSDPQGYTVKVRTAGGKIGYVTRFQVTIEPSQQVAAQVKASVAETDAQAQGGGGQPDQHNSDSSKSRIYVSDSESWLASGGFGNSSTVAPGNLYGGYNPEMADIYQDFTSDCPTAVVTQQKSKADYAVLFDKQSSKKGLTGLGGLVKVNKVTVLSKNGETLLSETSHSADTAVKMACDAIGQRHAASSH